MIKKLFSKRQIQKRINYLAKKISADYKGEDLVIIGILKGSFIFLADLIRRLKIPLELDFVQLASYGKKMVPSKKVKVKKKIDIDISKKYVLIVDDIVDTGRTIKFLIDDIKKRKPRSVKACALLDKPSRREVKVKIDYLGFSVPNKFIIGFGADLAEKYRNLDYVGYIEK